MIESTAHVAKDFFISYTQADKDWAEWIAWQLEEQGCTTVIQAWDFRPGDNFVSEMHRAAQEAECTLAVLSPDYITSGFAQAEWAASFVQDPTGEQGQLLPVRVRECDVKGLLSGMVYIDLVEQAETAARDKLLAGVHGERVKPTEEPHFPGRASPHFPGAAPPPGRESHPHNLTTLWRWLSNAKHQKTLALLGGGVAVGVGGLWQVYDHFSNSDASSSRPTPETRWAYKPAPQIVASGGGIAAGGGDVIQTGPGTVHYYGGISEERFQALSAELAVNEALLKSFFEILDRNEVPPEDLNSTLPTIAKRFKELTEKLATFTSEDPAVNSLKAQSRKALETGDFERAEALLTHAKEKDIQAARQMRETANKRLLSAAATAAEQGDLKNTQLVYAEAATYYQEAGKLLPTDEEETLARYLNTEGSAWLNAGKYANAQTPLERAVALREKILGPDDHLDVAASLDNLASLYSTQSRYDEAEPLYQRALAIRERTLGPVHPEVAASLDNLASLYSTQSRYDEAEPLYQRALAIRERTLGPVHPEVAASLDNLASLYSTQSRYDEAVPLYQIAMAIQALAIQEKMLGPEHPDVATILNKLALLYNAQGWYAEAEPIYQRALAIAEKALGSEHPSVLKVRKDYADLQKKMSNSTKRFTNTQQRINQP